MLDIMLNTTEYSSKPDKTEVPAIIKNIRKYTMSVEDIAKAMANGATMRPGILMGGNKAEFWKYQQVFALDIDGGMSVDEAKTKLMELGVRPAFMYASFSFTDEVNKFRIVFVSDSIITDPIKRDKLQIALMLALGCADTRCKDKARIFFGGTKLLYEDYDAAINADDIINRFYIEDIEEKIIKEKTVVKKSKISKFPKIEKYNDIYDYEAQDVIPFANKIARDVAKFDVDKLHRIFDTRDWVEGDHRERFLFMLYNCEKLLHGGAYAYAEVLKYNSMMAEPLYLYALNFAIKHTDEHVETDEYWHGDGVYTFNPDTIAEWLELEDDVAEDVGLYATKNKKLQYKENQQMSMERDVTIAEMFLVEGMKVKDIQAKLEGKLSCSLNTVYNTLSRLGIDTKDRGNINLFCNIDFDGNKKFQTLTKLYNIKYKNFKEEDLDNVTKNQNNLDVSIEAIASSLEPQDYTEAENHELYLKNSQRAADFDIRKEAVSTLLNTQDNVLILGKGGTGKTYLIKNMYYDTLSCEDKACTAFLAFTGQAATALPNGRTIHSFFVLDKGVIDPHAYINYNNIKNLLECDTLIIDEIGQIRVDLFNYILKCIRYAECYYHHHVRLICLGDYGQVSPVITKEDEPTLTKLYGDKVYAYEAEFYDSMHFRKFVLTESKRQDNADFVAALDLLEFGCNKAVDYFNAVLDRNVDPTATYICGTRRAVKRYNEQAIARFSNKKQYPTLLVRGLLNLDEVRKAPQHLELAVGMKVMTTINADKYKNGSIGIITKLNGNSVNVRLLNGKTVTVRKHIYQYAHGSYEQLPLTYAYAITANKAQGMTLDKVNIASGTFFSCGQLYTAMSRCTDMSQVHLTGPISHYDLVADSKVLRYIAS